MFGHCSTGWTWGYMSDLNGNTTVGWNLIHHIGLGILSDMGWVIPQLARHNLKCFVLAFDNAETKVAPPP